MRVFSQYGNLGPRQALPVRHNPNLLVFRLQNRALLDVQFKESMHFARANSFITAPTDTRQLIPKGFAVSIRALIGPFLTV